MDIRKVNTADNNIFWDKSLFKKELFKKNELDCCTGEKKAAPIRELLQDTVQFSKK